MWEVILKLIEQLNSSVFVLLLILIIAFLVCYKAGGIVNSFKSFKEDNKSVKDRIEDVKETLLSKIDSVKDKLFNLPRPLAAGNRLRGCGGYPPQVPLQRHKYLV